MALANEFLNKNTEWDAFYSYYVEKLEDYYIRWLNCDLDLTEDEVELAITYQKMLEEDEEEPDVVEIEIPPEHDISPEEFDAFIKVVNKLKHAGLTTIIDAMLGNTAMPMMRGSCMKGIDLNGKIHTNSYISNGLRGHSS